jgi:hypothetical protein
MTESEWLTTDDPRRMLRYLEHGSFERRLRLFAVACVRRIWHLIDDERLVGMLELAERHADGDVPARQMLAAQKRGNVVWQEAFARLEEAHPEEVTHRVEKQPSPEAGRACAIEAALSAAMESPRMATSAYYLAQAAAAGLWRGTRGCPVEAAAQADLLRDIFGNPYRPVGFRGEWRTREAVSLAEGMYASRDFAAMPILGDALEEVGCADEAVLGHCRSSSAHVRGCWVADLILDKS